MEFAISALFLLILLLPGFILHAAYTKGFWRWNSPTTTKSLTEQIPSSFVEAAVLHFVWVIVCSWFGYAINLSAVLMLLLGSYGHDEKYFETALNSLTDNSHKVFGYFISLYIGSALFGYASHYLVRKFKLDRKTRILRFNNEWFYLLSGEITEFKESTESPSNVEGNLFRRICRRIKAAVISFTENPASVDGVYLTSIVHHNDKDYLYRGIVADFFFDKLGNLDRVLLKLAHRRELSDDRKSDQEYNREEIDGRYYNIEGDYFILRYSEMSTINLDYFFVMEEEAQSANA